MQRLLYAALLSSGLLATTTSHAIVVSYDYREDDSPYRNLGNQNPAAVWINIPIPGYGFGSGTLIAPDWVLTAAHVVADKKGSVIPSSQYSSVDIDNGSQVFFGQFGNVGVKQIVPATRWGGPNSRDGRDIALIQLDKSVTVAPMSRYNGDVNSLLKSDVTVVGYGTTGDGTTGGTTADFVKRGMNNVIDVRGRTQNSSFSDNIVLSDFDSYNWYQYSGEPRVYPDNRWGGSPEPKELEGSTAPGDSGGPWIVGGKIAAVTSFGQSRWVDENHDGKETEDEEIHGFFGFFNGATAVQPHNDWINSVMGGVNWNARTTLGSISFDTASAWGDGRVPGTGKDVRFSLPYVDPFLYGSPRISFPLSTTVRNVHVEFGPHEFLLGGTTFEATGRATVDRGGTLSITNGFFTVADQFRIGETDDTSYFTDGKVKVGTGGRLIITDDTTNGLFVGQNGHGILEQTGGRVEVIKDAFFGNIGTPNRSRGTYEFSGGNASFARHLYVGNYGDGIVNQSGSASANVGIDLYLGLNTGGGYYGKTGGTLYVNRAMFVGYRGTGTFDQSAGETTTVSDISLGRFDGSVGSLSLLGGSIACQDDIVVGYAGRGTMEITGGLATATTAIYLGYDSTGNGTIRVSESAATLESDHSVVLGRSGYGLFEQSGGTVKVGGDLTIATAANSTGIYNLSGGVLDVSQGWIQFGAGTQKEFNFTGGTLHVGTYNDNLINAGGALAPQDDNFIGGLTRIAGNYTQSAGSLDIELGQAFGATIRGVSYDAVDVGGLATLGGLLRPSLLSGFVPESTDSFRILNAANIVGSFANELLGRRIPTGDGQASFQLTILPDSINGGYSLWLDDFLAAPAGLPGDFDSDGDVDGRDFLAWQRNPNVGNLADWQSNYGQSNGTIAGLTVPEPTTLVLFCGVLISCCLRRFQAA